MRQGTKTGAGRFASGVFAQGCALICAGVAVAAADSTNRLALLEQKLNNHVRCASSGREDGADVMAFNIARSFSSAECAAVTLDGYPANFIVEAGVAAAYMHRKDWTNAIAHGELALAFRSGEGMGGAPERASRLLLDLARAYSSAAVRRYDKADDYREWARELDPHNAQIAQTLALDDVARARRNGREDEAEHILRAAIAAHGFAKRIVYQELGNQLWDTRRGRDAFAMWLAQLKDVRLDFHEDSKELGIDNLRKTMTLADEALLLQCAAVLRALPARYPATLKFAPFIGELQSIANDPRIEDELLMRTAAHEYTPAMEQALRAFMATHKPVPGRVFLYLGDNLCARGRPDEAIDMWLEGMAAPGHRAGDDGADWFAARIIDQFAKASSAQVSRCVFYLERQCAGQAPARMRLGLGEQLERLGQPDRALRLWCDALAAQPRPYLQTQNGDWFMMKLDARLATMTPQQKAHYADIIGAQIEKWRTNSLYHTVVPLLDAKRTSLLR